MKKCGSIYHTFSVYKGGVFMRLDKFLKVSRIIKRRTLSKEISQSERVKVNGKVAKPSTKLKVGDIIEIEFGRTILTVKVNLLKEHVLKDESTMLYEIVDEKRKETNEL